MFNRYHNTGWQIKGWLRLVLILLMVGPTASKMDAGELPKAEIYLINHGWHTGLVLRTRDFPLTEWPETLDFRPFPYIEVGWGDREFYQTPQPSTWQTLKAALWPTDSVLFVYGHTRPPDQAYGTREIFILPVNAEARMQLLTVIRKTYFRDDQKQIREVGQYAGGRGRFYRGRNPYHLPHTCNTWVAQVLMAAGFEVNPQKAMRAEALIRQVRQIPSVHIIHSNP